MSSLFLFRRLRIHLETEVLPQQTLPCNDVRAFFPGRQAALLVEVVYFPPILLGVVSEQILGDWSGTPQQIVREIAHISSLPRRDPLPHSLKYRLELLSHAIPTNVVQVKS